MTECPHRSSYAAIAPAAWTATSKVVSGPSPATSAAASVKEQGHVHVRGRLHLAQHQAAGLGRGFPVDAIQRLTGFVRTDALELQGVERAQPPPAAAVALTHARVDARGAGGELGESWHDGHVELFAGAPPRPHQTEGVLGHCERRGQAVDAAPRRHGGDGTARSPAEALDLQRPVASVQPARGVIQSDLQSGKQRSALHHEREQQQVPGDRGAGRDVAGDLKPPAAGRDQAPGDADHRRERQRDARRDPTCRGPVPPRRWQRRRR